MDLLNHQQPNTQPSVDISALNVSLFGPWSEEENVEAHTVEDRKETRKWTPTEDQVLISAWLNTSKNPVVGKWCGASTTKDKVQSKRRKLDEHSAQSSTSVAGEDDQSKRPIGVKAAKAKGKRAVSNATKLDEEEKELQSIWGIRQKNFALKDTLNKQKDTLNKQKLLDSLIAKTEPLTELELALKNKLIKDMLSL
uniref:No apical meristem-associated C-terminal domain-containing protein n=1 Tax=Brassica oleracea var. oleracea TaxID=109376 RepID=A0A0D3CJH9_BRAOL